MKTWATHSQDRIHSPLRQNMVTTNMTTHNISPTTTQTTSHSQSTEETFSQDTLSSQVQRSHKPNNNYIQPKITKGKGNIPFGDLLQSPKPQHTVRFLFQNVNGIQKANSWKEFSSFSQKITQVQVDVFGAAETNLKWNHKLNQQAKSILQKHHKNCSINTSSNREECYSAYQPGGTLTTILNKYVGRIQSSIIDKSSLGRWSGFRMNTNFGHYLNIITVYQPTKSDGLHTTYQQQVHYYRTNGVQNPDPRKLLLQDLETLIREFNHQKDETIILIDANDGLQNKSSLLPTFLSKTNLVSLIPNSTYHPPIHTRGSQCIDFIFGPPRLLDHIHAAGISAWFDQPWPNTDHRHLFVDIDEIGLFGATLETIPPPTRRVLTSKSKKSIEKFIENIQSTNKIDDLLHKLKELSNTTEWTTDHHQALEEVDTTFTDVLLQAESKCATPVDFPWSPTIQTKATVYQYWLTKLHGIKNNINVHDQLKKIN
jgi:hypothetical protein